MNASTYLRMKVAVIEDESYTRKLIVASLRRLSFGTIYEAADGKEGLDMVVDKQPDIVLCDIHMVPVDGLTFLKTLRRLTDPPGISQTPVIFLTADSQTDTVLSAKEYRVDGYLVKPVNPLAMKARIDAALARR
ncbi:MAG: hypothetical protein OHK0024_13240 [Thalassobaculales bacterium]